MSELDAAAHFKLFTLRNFLDAEICAHIRREAVSSPTTQAPVYLEGSDSLIHETVRKTTSFHPSEETISQVHERLSEQKALLERHFNRGLTDCERPQFLRYGKGDFFVRHQDGNTTQLDFDHLRIRRISIVVFLNDFSFKPNSNCFYGGTLNFYDETNPDTPRALGLLGETGLLLAFKADTFHEVAPIISGERFTIISWFR